MREYTASYLVVFAWRRSLGGRVDIVSATTRGRARGRSIVVTSASLVSAGRFLQLNPFLLIAIITVVLVELVTGWLRVDGSLSGVLRRWGPGRIVRRSGSHPASAVPRRQSALSAHTGIPATKE